MAKAELETRLTNTVTGTLSFAADGTPSVVAGAGFTAAETTVDATDGDFTITIDSSLVPVRVISAWAHIVGDLAADKPTACRIKSWAITNDVLTLVCETFYYVVTDGPRVVTETLDEPDTTHKVCFGVTYEYEVGGETV